MLGPMYFIFKMWNVYEQSTKLWGKLDTNFPYVEPSEFTVCDKKRLLQICSQSGFHITDAVLVWIDHFGDLNSLKDNIKVFSKELKYIFSAGSGFVSLITDTNGRIFWTQ